VTKPAFLPVFLVVVACALVILRLSRWTLVALGAALPVVLQVVITCMHSAFP